MRWHLRFFDRERTEKRLDNELGFHLEQQVADYVAAGIEPDEARRRARLEFGGLDQTKEECRDVGAAHLVETFIQDLRYGLRQLRRSPGFTAVAVLTLALGIGANTAIFSVVNAVLLRPLPYPDSDRLVVILHFGSYPVAPANFLDWRRQNHVFQRMGAAEYWTPNLTGIDKPERVWALHVTSDILPLLGVQPLLGRMFLPEEDQHGHEHEVILSFRAWQRRFGMGAGIIGRPVALDGETYTIVGVMPPEFKFAPFWATKAELWAPLSLAGRESERGANSLRVFARLKPTVALPQARAEMTAITSRLEQEYPGTNRDYAVLPLKDKVVGDIRPALVVLLGAVSFVLLIACANVAHMLLARSAARRKEVAVRTALGAGRSRMIRQFLTESIVLTFFGSGAGLLLALWGIRVLVRLSPAGIPRVDTVTLDGHVLLFMLVTSILTGVGFSVAPAFQAAAVNLNDCLKDGGRGSTEGVRQDGLRNLLVGSEFALALILLVGAGLMIRSFAALQAIDPGFDPDRVLSMLISVSGSKSADPSHLVTFHQQLLEQVRALPGVKSASAINHLPLAGDLWTRSFIIQGRPLPRPGEGPEAVYRLVMPGYFQTMRIPVLRGRDVTGADNLDSPGVVIVNEVFARNSWPGENPVGKSFALEDSLPNPQWLTVIGVVRNTKQGDWASTPDSEMYLPFLQDRDYRENKESHSNSLTLVVRAAGDAASLATAVESAVWALDKNVTVSEVQTMQQVVTGATAQPRFYLVLLGVFAAVALILAGAGIYGVMSYSVSRRTHEISVRMALGAQRDEVVRLVTAQGMMPALSGAAVGIAGCFALTRMMSSLLYGVRPQDPLTITGVLILLVAVALGASYLPARRAAKADPMVALRCE